MAINARRNKPFGPGGSTRRLHQIPLYWKGSGMWRGRYRIDEGVKGEAFARDGSVVIGPCIVANDNYAPVAQAA